ncbi:MAG: hypothetical protein ABFD90_04710 [Phycisphaerales bacterium]
MTVRTEATGMSNTMVRRFCTLKEAAERLDTTQEQVETLLRKGILHEFRDGPHRLLKTADVAAIVAASNRRDERQSRAQTQRIAVPFPSQRDDRSGPIQPGRPVVGVSQIPDNNVVRPAAGRPGRKDRDFTDEIPTREPTSRRSERQPLSSKGRRTAKKRARPEAVPERQTLALREWFWAGLTQDRPITIALFSAFVLLVLSAAVLGACMLTNIL